MRREKHGGHEQAKPDCGKEKHWPVNPPQPEREHWTDFENGRD
jgi:hypothetical protein